MHGVKETTSTLRIYWFIIHSFFLFTSYSLCFTDSFIFVDNILGVDFSKGDFYRKCCLIAFGTITYLRMNATIFYMLKRKILIDEFFGVIIALGAYQVAYTMLGGWKTSPLSILDICAIFIFLLGSFLNTFSEIQRKTFKNDIDNQGKLYTSGLFKYARHINYFGDICWVSAWAIMTHNMMSSIIPIFLTLGFIFFFIPGLSNYLADNYGNQYNEWTKKTKKLFPFIY